VGSNVSISEEELIAELDRIKGLNNLCLPDVVFNLVYKAREKPSLSWTETTLFLIEHSLWDRSDDTLRRRYIKECKRRNLPTIGR